MPIYRFTARNGGWGYTQKVTHFPLDEFTGGEQKTMVLALHAFDAWRGCRSVRIWRPCRG